MGIKRRWESIALSKRLGLCRRRFNVPALVDQKQQYIRNLIRGGAGLARKAMWEGSAKARFAKQSWIAWIQAVGGLFGVLAKLMPKQSGGLDRAGPSRGAGSSGLWGAETPPKPHGQWTLLPSSAQLCICVVLSRPPEKARLYPFCVARASALSPRRKKQRRHLGGACRLPLT